MYNRLKEGIHQFIRIESKKITTVTHTTIIDVFPFPSTHPDDISNALDELINEGRIIEERAGEYRAT